MGDRRLGEHHELQEEQDNEEPKIVLVSTVDLCQLDKVVNLASPVPGHSIDVGHWSPIQELTRSHRIRWSQEDLQELL